MNLLVYFKCGDKKQAVVAVPEANPVFENPISFTFDGVTEKVLRKMYILRKIMKHVFSYIYSGVQQKEE
jgi:hypothetical protein